MTPKQSGKPIPEDIQQLIKQRMDDGTPREQLCKELGISPGTLYRYIRLFGGTLDYTKCRRNKEAEQYIIEHYADSTAQQIAQILGINKTTVWKIARKLNLKHSEKILQQFRDQHDEMIRNRTPETLAKAASSHKRTRKRELRRILGGEPQQTKLKIRIASKRTAQERWRLCKRYGYIETTDPFTLFYDSNTRRMNEKLYTDKYHLRFEPDTEE